MADALVSFGFWCLGGGISVVLSIFSALALPVWDFTFITSANFSALRPVINAANWAIDFYTINQAFGIVVASLTAYTIAVFYWKIIGGRFLDTDSLMVLSREFGLSSVFDVIGNMAKKFLGLPI